MLSVAFSALFLATQMGVKLAARIDVPHYRETGEIRFLSDVQATAQSYVSFNVDFLRRRHISGR